MKDTRPDLRPQLVLLKPGSFQQLITALCTAGHDWVFELLGFDSPLPLALAGFLCALGEMPEEDRRTVVGQLETGDGFEFYSDVAVRQYRGKTPWQMAAELCLNSFERSLDDIGFERGRSGLTLGCFLSLTLEIPPEHRSGVVKEILSRLEFFGSDNTQIDWPLATVAAQALRRLEGKDSLERFIAQGTGANWLSLPLLTGVQGEILELEGMS